jgi:hypothetical protein
MGRQQKDIIFSKNTRLNEFIFASEFLQDAKDMRMLERAGKISDDRNMDELLNKDAPPIVPPLMVNDKCLTNDFIRKHSVGIISDNHFLKTTL